MTQLSILSAADPASSITVHSFSPGVVKFSKTKKEDVVILSAVQRLIADRERVMVEKYAQAVSTIQQNVKLMQDQEAMLKFTNELIESKHRNLAAQANTIKAYESRIQRIELKLRYYEHERDVMMLGIAHLCQIMECVLDISLHELVRKKVIIDEQKTIINQLQAEFAAMQALRSLPS